MKENLRGEREREKASRACLPPLSAERSSDFESSQLEMAREGGSPRRNSTGSTWTDEKSVKMLYSHVARGVQRGITTRVTPLVVLIVEEAPRATFPLLSAISDDLRENNLTLTLNVPVSSPRNTSPRAPRHFRYPVISLLAAVRNRRAAVGFSISFLLREEKEIFS